jgi:hypothetical protein
MVGASTTLAAEDADDARIAQAGLIDRPETRASIGAYVDAGNRMLTVMDMTLKVCVVVFAVVAVAWALGILPGAVRLV